MIAVDLLPTAAGVAPPSDKLVHLHGTLGGRFTQFLIDCGASDNFIHSRLVPEVVCQRLPQPPTKVRLANGQMSRTDAGAFRASVSTLGLQTSQDFLMMDLGSTDAILGLPWFRAARPLIDWSTLTVTSVRGGASASCSLLELLGEDHAPIGLHLTGDIDTPSTDAAFEVEPGDEVYLAFLNGVLSDEVTEADDPSVPGASRREAHEDVSPLNEKQRAGLKALLDEYPKVLQSKDLPDGDPPVRKGFIKSHKIDLLPSMPKPPCRNTYRLTLEEREDLKSQLTRMLEKGHIQPSKSPFGAPVLFAKKPDGSLRLCTDYRELNKYTVKNAAPLPRIDEILDSLAGARFFSTMDLTKGFNQIGIHPPDIHKTAFRTPFGHFEYRVMPFGLCNAPATFQSLMDTLFQPLIARCLFVYIDDLLIYSRTFEDHLKHIREVLDILAENDLYAREDKCRFARSSLFFCGHVVSREGIRCQSHKIKAVQAWPIPKSASHVRRFIGLAGYYRRFIPKFSQIAGPLTDLTQASTPFVWSSEAARAFNNLKQLLTTAPVLQLPDYSKPFVVDTDGSKAGLGAVLLQPAASNPKHLAPVAYASRKLSPAERNYDAHELELLALVFALKQWRHHLQGLQHFVCRTDNEALRWLFNRPSSDLGMRRARWLDFLSEFNFELFHIPGVANVVADALSRMHDPEVVPSSVATMPDFLAASHPVHDLVTDYVMSSVGEEPAVIAQVDTNSSQVIDSDDWQIYPQVFDDLNDLYGPLAIDAFASSSNALLDAYWTVDTNAFTQEWSGESVYGHPPFKHEIIDRMLDKAFASYKLNPHSTRFVGLVPAWHSAKWFTRLKNFTILHTFKEGERIMTASAPFGCPERRDLGPLPWPVLVVGLAPVTVSVASVSEPRPDQEFLAELREAALVDPDYQAVIKKVSATDENPDLFEKEGLLIKSGKWWVPNSTPLREKLIRSIHDGAFHLGAKKTRYRLGSLFYWPNLAKSVDDFVASCPICTRTKPSSQRPAGLLEPLPPPDGPWRSVSMDFVVGMPDSSQGKYDSFLTVVCRFSKRVILIPCHTTDSASDVARRFFDNVVARHNTPVEIVSDRDPKFTSAFWKALFKFFRTQLSMSTAHHPQSDGQTERVNRVVEEMLRGMILEFPDEDWVSYLPHCEVAINSSRHESSQQTPYELSTGFPFVLPEHLATDSVPMTANPLANSFLLWRQKVVAAAKRRLLDAQQSQKRYYDSRHRPVEFAVGDPVLVSTENVVLPKSYAQGSSKLFPKFVGPYPVLERVGKVAYRLGFPAHFNLHPVIHVSRLRAHVVSPVFSDRGHPQPPAELDDAGNENFEIEKLLKREVKPHGRGHRVRYLVRWLGYGPEDDMWRSRTELLRKSSDLVAEYDAAHPFDST